MTSFHIGEKLRQARVGQGLSIEQLTFRTRIPGRFLEAIEADDFDQLPGLVFTRNFVRQYGSALGLDPEPMLEVLPKIEESTLKLPDPPSKPRRPNWDPRYNSAASSLVWLTLAAGACTAAYIHFDQPVARPNQPVEQAVNRPATTIKPAAMRRVDERPSAVAPPSDSSGAVNVVISASQPCWVSLTADGKSAFSGTLAPNETKTVSASEQVKLVAGNAGGLAVSLNGRPLDSLGPAGQVRILRLTAEGPEFLSKVRTQPEPDPL